MRQLFINEAAVESLKGSKANLHISQNSSVSRSDVISAMNFLESSLTFYYRALATLRSRVGVGRGGYL